jgi:hypothetical protein
MARMKYVQRRANRYEFRFAIPDDIAGQPVPEPWPASLTNFINQRTGRFKTELVRSLQTTEGKSAERKALAHIAEALAQVEQARRLLRNGPTAGIAPDEIASLAREHEIELLERDERLRPVQRHQPTQNYAWKRIGMA